MPKDIPRWSIREAIQAYERTHNWYAVFSRSNKALIFGRAETNPQWHHNMRGEKFYSVILEVETSPSSVNHIPVLFSGSLMTKKEFPSSLAGTWLEVAGQYRSYNLIIDGARQLPLFVFAKDVSLFTEDSHINKPISTNAIFLDGYVVEYPILHFVYDGKDITELILTVPGFHEKVHYIPCVLYGKYARLATRLKFEDAMAFYGHVQNKTRKSYRSSPYFLVDHNTEYEVSVVDVQSSPMFGRCSF